MSDEDKRNLAAMTGEKTMNEMGMVIKEALDNKFNQYFDDPKEFKSTMIRLHERFKELEA